MSQVTVALRRQFSGPVPRTIPGSSALSLPLRQFRVRVTSYPRDGDISPGTSGEFTTLPPRMITSVTAQAARAHDHSESARFGGGSYRRAPAVA
eukprot:759967-Hanusia_phi.AAC.4